MSKGYEYLASPYTHADPLVREARYLAVMDAVLTLTRNGIAVYSPILHFHGLNKVFNLPPNDEIFYRHGLDMLDAGRGVLVLRLEGWAKSVGVTAEIKRAAEKNKSITYLMPGGLFDAASTVVINQDLTQPSAKGV